METRLLISNKDLEYFKLACESIDITILETESHKILTSETYVLIKHQILQDLYFLGSMVELKRMNKLHEVHT